ncbi:hypothetical protein Tco_0601202 [Tanacetum coccineum]
MESLNSNSQERELHQLQQMQDKAKESCMTSFRLLHSHLKVLSIKEGFKRACVALFDQDTLTFRELLLLNLDHLEKQLDKEEFQETESIDAFRVLMKQFQTFINFRYCFDDFDGAMIRKSFLEYTRTEIQQFRDTLIQHMESVKKSIDERAQHKRENNKAFFSSRSGKDTHAEDADINSVNDKQPLAEGPIQKVFANVALKNELRKLKGNSVDTKFAKPSILGKPVLQSPRNQSVVRQPNAFKSERPNFLKPRFASQVDVNNVLSKPVTPHYLPKVRESVSAKPHHVIAPGSSRNSSKESYGSNDMAHNYYLEEDKKKTQDKNRNIKPRKMPSAKTHNTPNACTPKPRSNNQTSWNWPASKSCEETLKAMQKADHSRKSKFIFDFQH